MLHSRSLEDIYQSLDESLGVKTRRVTKQVLEASFGLIVPGRPPPTRYTTIVTEERTEQWSKLVGVLFCMPTSKPGKEEILPNLDYFHHRSALFVDFFCVGYSPVRSDTQTTGKSPSITTVDGTEWSFSASDFNESRARLEAESKWRYSGETDLLLVVARKPRDGNACLDYSCAIACNLEAMAKDSAITSVRGFFEKIFQFGEQYDGDDPVWKLSDKFGLAAGGSLLQESILTLLPEQVRKQYKATQYLAVSNVSAR